VATPARSTRPTVTANVAAPVAAHRPANLARRIVKAWPSLSRAERAEVAEILAAILKRK
jgi:hypothetical protein